MLRLPKKWVNKLAKLPESGMNYQIVDLHLKNRDVIRRVFIFNCSEIRMPIFQPQVTKSDISNLADITLSQ